MKIALYQPYPHGLDGLQKIVTNLAASLHTEDCEALVILPEDGIYSKNLADRQIPYLICNPGPSWQVYGRGAGGLSYLFSPARFYNLVAYWFRLRDVLKKNRVSILHCNDYRAVLLAAPAARMLGIPCLWHMHGYIGNKAANLLAAALVNWTVPVSRGMLDYLNIPQWMLGRYHVIYNGLESDAHSTLQNFRPKPIALAVGNLHPRKGYDNLLRAFALVLQKVPQAECRIIGGPFGDGSHQKELNALADELDIASSVNFVGFSNEVSRHMQESRLLVSSSRVEAFGLVATEAMSNSLPVVATSTGGLKDIVADRETGFLVEINNIQALADRITELLLDPQKSATMGQAGRRRLKEHFTHEKMVRQFGEFYRKLLAEKLGTRTPDNLSRKIHGHSEKSLTSE